MMKLCASNVNSTAASRLPSVCQLDMLGLVFSGLLLVVATTIIIYSKCQQCGSKKLRTRVFFPLHRIRWLLLMLLLLGQITLISDGLLFHSLTCHAGDPSLMHLYLPELVSVAATLTSFILYNVAENVNRPQYLTILLGYWATSVTWKSVISTAMWQEGYNMLHIRQSAIAAVTFLYTALLIVECLVWKKLRYLCGRRQNVLSPPAEQTHIGYIHPYVNLPSRVTLHWLGALLKRGYTKSLHMADLGKLPWEDHSLHNFVKFEKIYQEGKRTGGGTADKSPTKPGSLWWCFWQTHRSTFIAAGLLRFLGDQMMFVAPMCLDYITNFVESQEQLPGQGLTEAGNLTLCVEASPLNLQQYFLNGYVLSLVILLATGLQATMLHNSMYLSVKEGIRCKGALQALVYDKTLRLSTTALQEGKVNQGQVINHMTVDPINICMFFCFVHHAWSLPLQVLTGCILLYVQLGISALVSALLITLMVPLQYYIGRHLARIQDQVMRQSDQRLKKSTELLQSIKLLKLYAWEALFCRAVLTQRNKELRLLFKACICRMISIVVTDGAPIIACTLTFALYPYMETAPLQTGKVFSAIALFNILAVPLFFITYIINTMGHALVSVSRLSHYLHMSDVPPSVRSASAGQDQPDDKHQTEEKCLPHRQKSGDLSDTLNSVNVTLVYSPHDPVEVKFVTERKNDQPQSGSLVAKDGSLSTDDPWSEESEQSAVVRIEGGTFTWDSTGNDVILKDLEVTIQQGWLVLVVGPVGSGKSSLLSALLGEMTTLHGSITWDRNVKVAYASQKAWLLNASLRDNILFGRPLELNAYNAVIDMCALNDDINVLIAGDDTEIGEKGVNLSGGQKQRISLARAIYSQADVLLLDDPFSALDAPVGKHIFTEAIIQHLVSHGKTVVLVTHQVQYLSQAHWVIAMNSGKIIDQGDPQSFDDIAHCVGTDEPTQEHTDKGNAFELPANVDLKARGSLLTLRLPEPPREDGRVESCLVSSLSPTRNAISMTSLNAASIYDEDAVCSRATKKQGSRPELGRLIEEEEHTLGSVSWKNYARYGSAALWVLVLLTLGCYTTRQGVKMAQDHWLSTWTQAATWAQGRQVQALANWTDHHPNQSLPRPDSVLLKPEMRFYRDVYIVYSLVQILLICVAIFCLEIMALNAARNIHCQLLQNIIRAPARFFDTTPLGRIINRLSGDTNIIDEKMPLTIDSVLFSSLHVAGGILMNVVLSPFFLIPAVPVLLLYVLIQRFYVSSSRELQRLDSITKSPILSHFSETLGGLSTIRAYRCEERFKRQNWVNIDQNNTAFLYLHTANIWMAIRLDYLGAFIVFAACISAITTCRYGVIDPSIVGLVVAYAIMINTFLRYVMQGGSELEMWFSAVERTAHYTDVQEEPYRDNLVADFSAADSWPTRGAISFDNVSLRYEQHLDDVVQNFTVNIASAEKVGICGRTGSGKTSLMLSLFRMLEVSDGCICIDDKDIAQVPLCVLRPSLAIIPQDPVLFSGTIRYNLDPERKRTESELWTALEIAQLKAVICELPQKLDHVVTEGGENFSLGQRQLFCLARAFLRDSKILVMDEATASIDRQTDIIIQEVIREVFKGKTVLTIAHRLSTIVSCDTILVLSNGRLVEKGSPKTLLQQNNSLFSQMVKENKL